MAGCEKAERRDRGTERQRDGGMGVGRRSCACLWEQSGTQHRTCARMFPFTALSSFKLSNFLFSFCPPEQPGRGAVEGNPCSQFTDRALRLWTLMGRRGDFQVPLLQGLRGSPAPPAPGPSLAKTFSQASPASQVGFWPLPCCSLWPGWWPFLNFSQGWD